MNYNLKRTIISTKYYSKASGCKCNKFDYLLPNYFGKILLENHKNLSTKILIYSIFNMLFMNYILNLL